MLNAKNKIVYIVYVENNLEFKKVSKKLTCDKVINHFDIITKLVKGDKFNKQPSKEIVNLYLYDKIKKVISSHKSKKILYSLNSLNENTISTIKEFMFNFSEKLEFILIFNSKHYSNNIEVINKLKDNIEIKILNYD